MISLIVFAILFSIIIRAILRLVLFPYRYSGFRQRGWGRQFGYGYGCGRGSGLLPLLGLLALGRLFGRRW